MRTLFFSLLFGSLFLLVSANDSNKWTYYLSYHTTELTEDTPDKVYAVASGSLFSYDKEDNSIRTYDKKTGLNDVNISLMSYNSNTSSLLLIYENGNMDIMEKDRTTNLPYLKESINFQDKTVHSIYLQNEYAYISTGFGIIKLDMKKKEITETYNLGTSVFSSYIQNGSIYAVTEDDIIYGDPNKNLLDKNQWENYHLNPGEVFNTSDVYSIFAFHNRLCIGVRNKGIYYLDNLSNFIFNNYIVKIKLVNDRLITFTSTPQNTNSMYVFETFTKYTQFTDLIINDVSSAKDNIYWIAQGENGLMAIDIGSGEPKIHTETIQLNGPYMNSPYKVVCTDSYVYTIAGGKGSNGQGFNNQGILMRYDYEKWTYNDDVRMQNENQELLGNRVRDYVSIAVDPIDEEHVYISSNGDGLAEITNMEYTKLHTMYNSLIEPSVRATSNIRLYQKTDGLCFDKEGNLWMNNEEANYGLKILDKNGAWHQIAVPYMTHKYTINNMLITSSNHKWINIPRPSNEQCIVVFYEDGTLDNSNDDIYRQYTSFSDQDGNTFSPGSFTCMAEDKNGYVWVGSNNGPVYFNQPDRVLTDGYNQCIRIKMVADNGEPFHFLENVRINCIAIDSGNRKWFGTENNGIYVLNDTNDELVHHFTTSTSPLLSDKIYSIDINHPTGEVFIGTDQGLISYKGEATEGQDSYSNVYAYPNPVRPEFNDQVTITGLMDNSNVKITDINGNMLYQTRSVGGQVIWNCRNASGKRVASGVYLVMASNENGSESVVTKIAIVK